MLSCGLTPPIITLSRTCSIADITNTTKLRADTGLECLISVNITIQLCNFIIQYRNFLIHEGAYGLVNKPFHYNDGKSKSVLVVATLVVCTVSH